MTVRAAGIPAPVTSRVTKDHRPAGPASVTAELIELHLPAPPIASHYREAIVTFATEFCRAAVV
jgi:hypothetical protein